MPRQTKRQAINIHPYVLWLGIASAYLVLGFILPANKVALSIYNLSASQYHVLLFFVSLPYTLVWGAALYGADKLKHYSAVVRTSREGDGLHDLALGSMWLAWGLIVPTFIGSLLNAVANQRSGFLPSALIITNYISLTMPIAAFWYIRKGAQSLTEHARIRLTPMNAQAIMACFIGAGVAFCFFAFRHLDIHSLTASNNPFFLPAWLLIITVFVPYLYVWFCGLIATNELLRYSRRVSGVLYRHAMQYLAAGMAAVIGSSVTVQCVRIFAPRTGHLSLSKTLALIYCIYVLMGIGFVLISLGAKMLRRIEEV